MQLMRGKSIISDIEYANNHIELAAIQARGALGLSGERTKPLECEYFPLKSSCMYVVAEGIKMLLKTPHTVMHQV